MTECFQNCRFCRKKFLKLPEQCKKLILENLLLMTSVEKTSYFDIAPPCHTILTNTLIIYYKISTYPKNIMFKKCSKLY